MAYKHGKWDGGKGTSIGGGQGKGSAWRTGSDREARERNEAKWAKAGVDTRHGIPARGRDDDLTRAMASETSTATTGTTSTTQGTGHAPAYPKPGQGLLDAWKGQPSTGGTKVERPFIEGGCKHTGVKLAITLSSGKRLYGAQAHQINDASHLDLIIDCAGLLTGRKFIKGSTSPRYRALNLAAWPDVITLAWPDMTAPTQVGIRFWERLLAMLPQETAVCCMGGHGRTGTALAALLVADGVDGLDAIKRVRAEHCGRAIETREQEAYIQKLAQVRDERKAQAQAIADGNPGQGKGAK